MLPSHWHKTTIGDCLIESTLRNGEGQFTHDDLRAVNKQHGMIPMREKVKGKSVERAKIVKKGWFAYNPMRINIGSICRWTGESDCIVSPDYVVFKCDDNTLDGDFLQHFCRSHHWNNFMEDAGRGSVRVRIYVDDLRQLKCVLPSVPEQKAIAAILSTWDDAIATMQRLIENGETQKRALMQRLLTPGNDETSGRDEGKWSVHTLDNLGTFFSGVTYSPADVTDSSGLLVLRSSNVQGNLICFDDNVYIGRDARVSTLTKVGDILICVRNGSSNLIGKTAAISVQAENLAHGAFMSLYRPNVEPEFCRQLFVTEQFQKLVSQNLGATINSINTSDMKAFSFLLPPNSQWSRIGQLLSAQDRTVEILRAQHLNLTEQRKGLLQQLLNGKRRVNLDKEKAA